ncbi:glycosyltransferase [Micromonospora sp. FIMYZ51]|uniref:glycosyltransferase n=1 Tax=Micromonospora sp. FIMYZ51 TaxID=3051832 RepID=UPI00311F2226
MAVEVSVIIPTYNRADQLRATLTSLARQSVPTGTFEVIVVDDGSTDGTDAVVDEFGDRLTIRYEFLERDLADIAAHGYCVSRVRNVGAASAASELLLFLDCGMVAGPELVASHRAAHRAHPVRPGGPGVAVLGYAYGTVKFRPFRGLAELLRAEPPELVAAKIGDGPRGLDMRHDELVALDYDLSRLAAPWILFWTLNVSVRTADFRAVGGFSEAFRGWGYEDIELGYRLFRHGCPIVMSRAAWGIEWPSRPDLSAMAASVNGNLIVFADRHPGPDVELYASIRARNLLRRYEEEFAAFTAWRAQVTDTDVADELAATYAAYAAGPAAGGSAQLRAAAGGSTRPSAADPGRPRVCVIGCGERVPPELPPAILVDFAPELAARAVRGSLDLPVHGLGLRLPCPDDSLDLVVVSSRMRGVWPLWQDRITAEAARVGAHLVAPPE